MLSLLKLTWNPPVGSKKLWKAGNEHTDEARQSFTSEIFEGAGVIRIDDSGDGGDSPGNDGIGDSNSFPGEKIHASVLPCCNSGQAMLLWQ